MNSAPAGRAAARAGRWTALVPMKDLPAAKTRLGALGRDTRTGLAIAMACDTLDALACCPDVAEVFLVTSDRRLRAAGRRTGATALPDGGPGLRGALTAAAAEATTRAPHARLIVVPGDLPCLTPTSLSRVIAMADASSIDTTFVTDRWGDGTTLLLARDGRLRPAYGEGSARAHAEQGAAALDAPLDCRLDVDTPADLRDAAALGLGLHTNRAVGRAAQRGLVDLPAAGRLSRPQQPAPTPCETRPGPVGCETAPSR